jgi:TRAP-type mannitol/chloroaromatic compound transport system permease large subunit
MDGGSVETQVRTEKVWGLTSIVASIVVLGSIAVGAWSTGQAVVAGDVGAMVLRFAAASILGAYALIWYRTARLQQRRPRS